MAWNISTRMHEREWLYCVPRARSASEIHIATTASAFWYWYFTTLETCTGFYMHETLPNVNSVPRDTWHSGRGFKSHAIQPIFFYLLVSLVSLREWKIIEKLKKNEAKIQKFVLEIITLKMQVFQLYLVDQASQQVVGTIFSNVRMMGRLSHLNYSAIDAIFDVSMLFK